ncbi:MAG: hypothetical protein K0S20_111 [Patescibacteria group bacterium]|jgi:hypothetical protein|nr:hypothetical protein [Patescibacteria group bacterium]
MNASEQISAYIAEISDWRGTMLSQLRDLINQAEPTPTEEWKWGVPVWTHQGLVCAISAFKNHVKINFFEGVNLPDPHHLINGGLDSKAHRSIDFKEGETINETALRELIQTAITHNINK